MLQLGARVSKVKYFLDGQFNLKISFQASLPQYCFEVRKFKNSLHWISHIKVENAYHGTLAGNSSSYAKVFVEASADETSKKQQGAKRSPKPRI